MSRTQTVSSSVVFEWNAILLEATKAHDGHKHALAAARVLALMHLAQHDAVNAVAPAYESYALEARDPAADPVAAAASAAHAVLEATFPKQSAMLGERCALGDAAAEVLASARASKGSSSAAESVDSSRKHSYARSDPPGQSGGGPAPDLNVPFEPGPRPAQEGSRQGLGGRGASPRPQAQGRRASGVSA